MMIRMIRLGFALTAALLGACTSVALQEERDAKTEQWHSIEVAAPSDRVVWQLSLLALQTQGFPLAAGADLGAGAIETGWKTDLQPFRGTGQRSRAQVRLAALEKGRWKLEARVRVEANKNLVSPLDPARAEWKPAADDTLAARTLLQHVRARLPGEFESASAPR